MTQLVRIWFHLKCRRAIFPLVCQPLSFVSHESFSTHAVSCPRVVYGCISTGSSRAGNMCLFWGCFACSLEKRRAQQMERKHIYQLGEEPLYCKVAEVSFSTTRHSQLLWRRHTPKATFPVGINKAILPEGLQL